MNAIREELKKRNIPELMKLSSGEKVKDIPSWEQRRNEIFAILNSEFSGYPPRFPVKSMGTVTRTDKEGFGGKAIVQDVRLDISSDFNSNSFPFQIVLPKHVKRPPMFVYLSFSPLIAEGIGEEILDQGYGIASVYYQDIAPDYYDKHENGFGRFCTRNPYDSWGKLRIWAFGASKILDFILDQDLAHKEKIAVMGHSRLGKAALLSGAFDERFSMAISNNSGAGGAALFRGKKGETIDNLYGKGSRLWFAGNFFKYLEDPEILPFDQHYLLALLAPRHLYVSSASKDHWADPESEFLSCVAAEKAFEIYGKKGLIVGEEFPIPGEFFHDGNIGYHLRNGTHYLSRYDWQQIIKYRKKHQV